MHACMYAYMLYQCIHLIMYIGKHTCLHIDRHVYMYIHTCVCMYKYIDIHVCRHTCITYTSVCP